MQSGGHKKLLMELCGACGQTKHQLIRVLLLARPPGGAGGPLFVTPSWTSTVTGTKVTPLEALADETAERLAVFNQARDTFADALDVPNYDRIQPSTDLDSSASLARFLLHMAALVAVDAAWRHETPPDSPELLSEYLLRREYEYWSSMHQSGRLKTEENTMRRTVFVATLTGGVSRQTGIAALQVADIANSADAAHRVLDDHRLCYPPTEAGTVLTPLYPDRLAEDFIALQLPREHQGITIGDDWYEPVPFKLVSADVNGIPPSYQSRIRTMLSEASQRYPHIKTEMLLRLTRMSTNAAPTEVAPETEHSGSETQDEAHGQLQQEGRTFREALEVIAQLQPSDRPIIAKMLVTSDAQQPEAWVRYIGEAAEVARSLTGTAPRLAEVYGPSRLRLLTALHTIVAMQAFLAATHSFLTKEGGPRSDFISPVFSPGIDGLFDLEVSIPTAAVNVNDNLQTTLKPTFRNAIDEVLVDLHISMSSADRLAFMDDVTNDAAYRYLGRITQIAADIPEFSVWLFLTDQEQTRQANADLPEAPVTSQSLRHFSSPIQIPSRLHPRMIHALCSNVSTLPSWIVLCWSYGTKKS